MNALYIIGNGFDLFHRLPTSYSHFHNYVIGNNTELLNTLDWYFSFETGNGYLWTNFEDDLRTFEASSFFDDNDNVNLSGDNVGWSSAFGLQDELEEETTNLVSGIKQAFGDWIDSIDIELVKPVITFQEDAFFLTFNYTLVLENVYKIDPGNILHIHGDTTYGADDLIFGHNIDFPEEPELDENGDSNRTMFTDAENASKIPLHAFRKPVEDTVLNNQRTFASLCNVREIFVLGHSLNEIDLPYLKEIIKASNNRVWYVTYYNEKEKQHHLTTLLQLGVTSELINLIKMDKLIK